MDINKEINIVQSTILQATNRLSELRALCKHPDYYLGFFSWRIGAIEVSRICNTCQINLPGTTEEEVNKFQHENSMKGHVT